ncbi:MAG: sugar ABC transporter substrate-binding protein [Rubellimicrobium sp.]|nr:sugar ABC transporter substrate-binding protein [Rubellimicrobium sp.]
MTPTGRLLTATAVSALVASGAAAQEINIYLIPSPSSDAIQSFIPAFEEETGIRVNVTETPYGEAHQKLLLSVQLGQGQYDVAQFDNTFLAPFGAAGTMMALDDYIAGSEAYDISDFSEGSQEYGMFDGESLGLVLSTEPMILWYRTDLFEELGLDVPETWEDYRAAAQAISEAGLGDGNILGWGPNASWWFMTLIWSFGGQLYDADLVPQVNTPEAVAGITFFKDMLAYGPEGGISSSGDDTTNKFLSQDIGMMVQYSGYWGVALEPENSAFVGNIATAKMPLGTVDITHLAGWNIGIPSDAQNPDEAWQFLEFVLGRDNAVDYLLAGAAAIGRKSVLDNPELLAIHPYLPLLDIPETSRIERYPQLRVWPELEKAILDALPAILTGEVEVQAGLDALNEVMGPILAQETAE